MFQIASIVFIIFISSRTITGFVPQLQFEHSQLVGARYGISLEATKSQTGTPLQEIKNIKSRINDEIKSTMRGLSAPPEQREKIDSLVRSLEELCPFEEPARMPDMAGKWIVEYTTAPPPSNGKLGPFAGIARQIIDLDEGTYVNYLSVPGDIEKEFLSARLEATFEEWDGTILKDDRVRGSKGEDMDGSGDISNAVPNETPTSSNWFQTSISTIFQTSNQYARKTPDYGANSWKVDFKTLTIKLFGIQLLQKSFDEGTSRVWKMSYLDKDGTRIVRAGRTGEDEDAMLFYMQKE